MLKKVEFFAGDVEVMQILLKLVFGKAEIVLDTGRLTLELFGDLRGSKNALVMPVDRD